jgi:DNA-binding MarR family transcriptional regulator
LTNEEWVQAIHELKPSERDVLYYIRTLAPFSDSQVDIGVRETARILKMNPSTISRALKVLDEKKYIDMELDRVKVTILPRGHAELGVLPTDNSVASTQHTRSPGNTLLLPRNTDPTYI